jgi:hypothetical protein
MTLIAFVLHVMREIVLQAFNVFYASILVWFHMKMNFQGFMLFEAMLRFVAGFA